MLIIIPCSNCGAPRHVAPRTSSQRCICCNAVTAVPDFTPPRPSLSRNADALVPAHTHGPKRAVVCGITYRNSPAPLTGCVQDARLMKELLQLRFRFPESSILFLTDEELDPRYIPTKENIRRALRWLVEGCQAGDSLFFHYSGHGGQVRDRDQDEVDGLDETICPVDFQEAGEIVDDEINEVIVRPLPQGVKLHAVIDACHSGTVLDLPYLCRMNRSGQYEWEDHRPPTGSWKGTSGGEAISFSGCDDHQTSADTDIFTKGANKGALTFSFIEAIKNGRESLTYGVLLNSMRRSIRTAHTRGIRNSTSFTLDTGFDILMQEPQLTSNEQFDVYARSFSL